MSNSSTMKIKTPEQIIKAMVEKYSTREDNIVHLERLFIAASVVRWVFQNTSNTEEMLKYFMQVDKYLQKEVELYWEEGIIKVRKETKKRV